MCGDGGLIRANNDPDDRFLNEHPANLDECEMRCRMTDGCAWFQYDKVNSRNCHLRKIGCESTV